MKYYAIVDRAARGVTDYIMGDIIGIGFLQELGTSAISDVPFIALRKENGEIHYYNAMRYIIR